MATTTDNHKQAFLDALAITGVMGAAFDLVAPATGTRMTYGTVKKWREDPAFDLAFHDALEMATDALEAEARRRAFEGVLRTRSIGSGPNAQIIDEYQYSDPLLMFLLKGARPDKFAERTKSELSGPGGTPIQTNDTAAAARIAAILDGASQRRAAATGGEEVDPFS